MTLNPKPTSKVAAYGFSLLVGVLLLTQCFEINYSRDAEGRRSAQINSKEPPIAILVPGLTLIGMALGINLSPESIAKLLSGRGE